MEPATLDNLKELSAYRTITLDDVKRGLHIPHVGYIVETHGGYIATVVNGGVLTKMNVQYLSIDNQKNTFLTHSKKPFWNMTTRLCKKVRKDHMTSIWKEVRDVSDLQVL